jgi:hypothetical protein
MAITIEINRERRLDMLVGALEGGSNYWCIFGEEASIIIGRVSPSNGVDSFAERLLKTLEAGESVPVHDAEDETVLLGTLSLETIERGEQLMYDNFPNHFADILSENDDAITADIYFQYAVLGEIVYG